MGDQKLEDNRFLKLQRFHHLAIIKVVCIITYWFALSRRKFQEKVNRGVDSEAEKIRPNLLKRFLNDKESRNIIRMSSTVFVNLCDLLVKEGGLRTTLQVCVEEQVAKSLYLLGHNVTNRELRFFFRRSGETVSRHFHNFLGAIIELEEKFLKQPGGSDEAPLEIYSSSRFYPYFKDCVGAIDGTHIRVKVSSIDAPRYRGRKDYPTQNVLAACTFDLKFTYVLPEWEGTASDSRIIKNVLTRTYPLIIPKGKYYLVDAEFMLRSDLITPYRGARYHLKEYSRNPPRNAQELFNNRHSSLRNVIERAFGVLKKRFPIIVSAIEPNYGVKTQNEIIVACCILHNYLMGVDPDENLLHEVDAEIYNIFDAQESCNIDEGEETLKGECIRDSIAASMWLDYQA